MLLAPPKTRTPLPKTPIPISQPSKIQVQISTVAMSVATVVVPSKGVRRSKKPAIISRRMVNLCQLSVVVVVLLPPQTPQTPKLRIRPRSNRTPVLLQPHTPLKPRQNNLKRTKLLSHQIKAQVTRRQKIKLRRIRLRKTRLQRVSQHRVNQRRISQHRSNRQQIMERHKINPQVTVGVMLMLLGRLCRRRRGMDDGGRGFRPCSRRGNDMMAVEITFVLMWRMVEDI